MILAEWRRFVEQALSQKKFENPSSEAKWLLAGALERESAFVTLHPTYRPSPQEESKIHGWLARRLKGEPLSRLKGVREFWSLPFHLNEHTLDPRPETEVLVEGVLRWVGKKKDESWRILDLGTGSGCVLISLLHELQKATGTGIDLSEGALGMSRFNAALNGVKKRATFRQSNWGDNLEGTFDIIVSNPPYIAMQDKGSLEKNVLHFDPALALFGGDDGLEAYRALVTHSKRLLDPKGLLVLEIGYGQQQDVEALFHVAGLETLFVLKDLAGIERTIGFMLSDAESFL